MSKRRPHIFALLLAGIVFQACIRNADVEPNTPRGNFESLWKTVDTRYCYLAYKNIDWQAVYRAYSPMIDTVSNAYSLFDVLAGMLSELQDGHVNLYSSFDRSRYWKWYTDYPANFNSDIVFGDRYLGDNYRIAGAFRYKKIANGAVGYVYYGSFSSNFSAANTAAIFSQFADCKGLIIDVRNNGGGFVSNSDELASHFFTEKTLTSYIRHKTGKGHNDFSEPTPIFTTPHATVRWERPVVVLTNRMAYSATNDFVCRMKYAPRATIVGDKTGGGGGLPLSSELPNGWMVRFSASPLFDAEMNNIEWGIDPDIAVATNRSDELLGFDTLIERAIREIMEN